MGQGPDATSSPGATEQDVDPVDEQIDESFPASDPPVGWAGEDPRDVPEPGHPPDGD